MTVSSVASPAAHHHQHPEGVGLKPRVLHLWQLNMCCQYIYLWMYVIPAADLYLGWGYRHPSRAAGAGAGAARADGDPCRAVDETLNILLEPPPPLAGVSIAIERARQQSDSTLVVQWLVAPCMFAKAKQADGSRQRAHAVLDMTAAAALKRSTVIRRRAADLAAGELSFVILLHPHSACSRCFNRDGERASKIPPEYSVSKDKKKRWCHPKCQSSRRRRTGCGRPPCASSERSHCWRRRPRPA